jgi:hypothetical protein
MVEIPSSTDNFLENLWDALLSRQSDQIRAAFQSLDSPSQDNVLVHLTRMVTEEGWQPEQVVSAQSALNVLKTIRS